MNFLRMRLNSCCARVEDGRNNVHEAKICANVARSQLSRDRGDSEASGLTDFTSCRFRYDFMRKKHCFH